MHADHVAGLPGLFHAVANADRTDPLTIYGPTGTAAVVRALRVIAPLLPYELTIREVTSGESFVLPGGLIGNAFRGDHRLPCNSYRLDLPRGRRFLAERAAEEHIPLTFWTRLQRGHDVVINGQVIESDAYLGPPRKGLSVGFVTDTRPVAGLAGFLDGVDLLICEGTYGDSADQQKAIDRKHMTFAEAANLAKSANAGALWLTHFSPAVDNPLLFRDNATNIFPNTTIGFSGLSATLTFSDNKQEPEEERCHD
jgi:ribonuclease Z